MNTSARLAFVCDLCGCVLPLPSCASCIQSMQPDPPPPSEEPPWKNDLVRELERLLDVEFYLRDDCVAVRIFGETLCESITAHPSLDRAALELAEDILHIRKASLEEGTLGVASLREEHFPETRKAAHAWKTPFVEGLERDLRVEFRLIHDTLEVTVFGEVLQERLSRLGDLDLVAVCLARRAVSAVKMHGQFMRHALAVLVAHHEVPEEKK